LENDKKNSSNKKILSSEEELHLLREENIYLKEVLENLKKKEKELEILVEEAGTAMLTGNNKGQITGCNKKAITLTGYTREELKQKKINEILDNQQIPKSFTKKIQEEPPNTFTSEQKLIKKNGKKVYVSTITTLLPNNQYQIIIKDIDARKKAELALIDSERRFRTLTENMFDVVWTTDNKLKTIFISSSIVNLTEFPPEYYYKKPLNKLVTSISYRLIIDTLRDKQKKLKTVQSKNNKYYISIDIKLLHKTKGSVWVNLKAIILRNKFGDTIGYQGVFRDIEDKKQILQSLKQHKKKYDFALESIQASIWELDKNLIKIDCDKHISKLLGYDQKKNILFSDWINTIYPDDRIYVIDILESILDNKILHKTYECRRIHKDNYILWFKDHAKAIIDENGNITGIIGSSKNITTEKRIEDKKFKYYAGLQLLIDSAIQFLQFKTFDEINNFIGETLIKIIPNSVIIIGEINEHLKTGRAKNVYGANYNKLIDEFKTISWNPFKEDVPISESFIEKIKQRDLIKYGESFSDFFKDISTISVNEFIKNKFNFKEVYFIGIVAEAQILGNIIILLKEQAKIISPDFLEAFIYIASINIHKMHIEKELNLQKLALQKSKKRYKKLNATKDKFFSIISHDLKNPFNTIIGFSGLIMNNYEKLEREKIKEFSKLIYEAANSSYEMMQNLFQWAKSQRGKLKPIVSKLNINELVDSNIKLFASELIKKELKIEYTPIDEPVILSDYNIIDTVLRNLLSNAIKFSNRNTSIIITVKKEPRFMQVSVSDKGIGIKEENKNKIFHIESGKSTYGTEQERGSGLGLILCKEFIELLEGKIWFESEEGKGSTFYYTVPFNSKSEKSAKK